MTRHLRFLARSTLLVVALAIAVASAHAGSSRGSHRAGDMPGVATQLPQGGGFDRAFIDKMVPHHQLATEMARLELARGKRPQGRALARAIITAQNDEITLMKRWRAAWFGSSRTPGAMSMEMPGMNVAKLESARDVDRAFMTEMIPHHRSAISMARQATTGAKHLQLRALAGRIITAQQREIMQMQRWLKAWYG
jgi:uncharacterized protein (DUF305 family)